MQTYANALLSSSLDDVYQEILDVGMQKAAKQYAVTVAQHRLEVAKAVIVCPMIENGVKLMGAMEMRAALDADVAAAKEQLASAEWELHQADAKLRATQEVVKLRGLLATQS